MTEDNVKETYKFGEELEEEPAIAHNFYRRYGAHKRDEPVTHYHKKRMKEEEWGGVLARAHAFFSDCLSIRQVLCLLRMAERMLFSNDCAIRCLAPSLETMCALRLYLYI